jgi:hypothetical protein
VVGDVVERRVQSSGREHLAGGHDDALAVELRVAA